MDYITKNIEKDIAIIASGDPCFYGIANYIKNNFKGEIEIVPGISSFQYLMCKLQKAMAKCLFRQYAWKTGRIYKSCK